MPTKKPQLANNEIYHVITRGVGDTTIFAHNDDYDRATLSIYEFNNEMPIVIRDLKNKDANRENQKRSCFVEILAFCFMPNHVHLLLRQIANGGISKFMKKFGVGYAGYFNRKHNRKGHLFQGRFRAIHIESDEQLKIAFVYIHTNPISLIEPGWKEGGFQNSQKVIKYLENYKWSSYQDYLGVDNFPSLTERDFLLGVMGGKENCRRFVNDWIEYKQRLDFSGVKLE